MALLIKADGTDSEVRPKGKKFTLEELYQHVGCSTVELLVLPGQPRRDLWMDEDGKATRKPVNERATALARPAGIARADFVVGDVLITAPSETE